MLTTHAPGLAGELSMGSIRFMEKDGGVVKLTTNESAGGVGLFQAIGDRLGMLPDNGVKVLICVEGANDVRFLKAVSRTLHATDVNLPDLGSDHRFMIIPMHGSNLRDVVQLELFRNYGRPECHIYDRDEASTYSPELSRVEGREDGSRGFETKKRYMESYIHDHAIRRVFGVDLRNDGEIDVVAMLSQGNGGSRNVKRRLSLEVAGSMSVEEIDEIDGDGEIRTWLQTLAEMAN